MTIGLKGSEDGLTGSIQINGIDVATFDENGLQDVLASNPTITDYTETVYSTTGTSLTVDLANGTIQKLTTAGASTISLPGSVAGKSFMVIVAYGGSHAVSWTGGTSIKWTGGTAPTQTSTTGKFDIFTFFQDGTNTYGSIFGQGF